MLNKKDKNVTLLRAKTKQKLVYINHETVGRTADWDIYT